MQLRQSPIFRHEQPDVPARQIAVDMRGFLSRTPQDRDFRFEKDAIVPSVHRAAQRVGSVLDSLMDQGLEESQLSAFVRQHYSALGLSVDALQDPSVLNDFVGIVLKLKANDLERKSRMHLANSESGKTIDNQLNWLKTYATEAKVFLTRGLYRRWLLNASSIVRELELRKAHLTSPQVDDAIRTLRVRAATVMAQAQAYDHANDIDSMENPTTSDEDSLIGSLAVLLGDPEQAGVHRIPPDDLGESVDEPGLVFEAGRGDREAQAQA